MDYVKPLGVVESMLAGGAIKLHVPPRHLVIRGMLLGANVTASSWWLWNQIPVTLGNLVGGMLFTGMAIYLTHRAAAPAASHPAPTVQPTLASAQQGYSPSF